MASLLTRYRLTGKVPDAGTENSRTKPRRPDIPAMTAIGIMVGGGNKLKLESTMIYYGIKTPALENQKSYISWLGTDPHESWNKFLSHNPHRAPVFTAVEAYKAIGYSCVKLNVTEIEPEAKE